jgi:hypothetical protein
VLINTRQTPEDFSGSTESIKMQVLSQVFNYSISLEEGNPLQIIKIAQVTNLKKVRVFRASVFPIQYRPQTLNFKEDNLTSAMELIRIFSPSSEISLTTS